jgi:hypothetical protein
MACRELQQNIITKTTWNIIKKERGKLHSVAHVRTLVVNDEKLKDQRNVANSFSHFFITVTAKLNI